MHRPDPLGRNAASLGFTLFEVLAAILIFGLLYTVLAQVAIRSIFAEGDSGRRLAASLLADRAIVEIETLLEQGEAPPIGESESEQDEFVVRTSVRAFDGSALLPAPGEAEASAAPDGGKPTLLAPPGAQGPATLLEIGVVVSWSDGLVERSVSRTSYGFDRAAAGPLLEGLRPPEAGEAS